MHRHKFVKHVALRTSFGKTAWLNWAYLSTPPREDTMWRWQCVDCGEQGYEVPA